MAYDRFHNRLPPRLSTGVYNHSLAGPRSLHLRFAFLHQLPPNPTPIAANPSSVRPSSAPFAAIFPNLRSGQSAFIGNPCMCRRIATMVSKLGLPPAHHRSDFAEVAIASVAGLALAVTILYIFAVP